VCEAPRVNSIIIYLIFFTGFKNTMNSLKITASTLALFLTTSTALFAPSAKEVAAEKQRMDAVRKEHKRNPNASVSAIATVTNMKASQVRTALKAIQQEKQDRESKISRDKNLAKKAKALKKGKK
jgi:hypothetical protein